MIVFTNAEEVIKDAFENNLVKGLFKDLYQKSPVGQERFQEIAKKYGEEALKNKSSFLDFANKVGFSGIEKEYDSNDGCWIGTSYKFDGLLIVEDNM